jgi:hypothetical protein
MLLVMVHPTAYVKKLAQQTIRDQVVIAERVRRAGDKFDWIMRQLPKSYTKEILFKKARVIPGAPPPDRICHRGKDALICWFIEYAPNYLEHTIASDQTPLESVDTFASQESQDESAAMHCQPSSAFEIVSDSWETYDNFSNFDNELPDALNWN